MKALRRNSNDRKRAAIDRNLAAHNRRIAAQTCLPKRISQYEHWVSARRLAFGRKKKAAQSRPKTEYLEIIACHVVRRNRIRFSVQADCVRGKLRADDAREWAFRLLRDGFPIRIRSLGQDRTVLLPETEDHNLARIFDGQRPKQQGINEAEDRGVCANA